MQCRATIGSFVALGCLLAAAVPNFAQVVSEKSATAKPSESGKVQLDGLHALSESLAGELVNHEAGNVFVVDFEELHPEDLFIGDERVGYWLADLFSDALSKSAYNLKVMDRRQYTFTLTTLQPRFDSHLVPPEPLSVGRSIGADTVVEGTYLIIGDKIYLTVAAFRVARMVECISTEVGVVMRPSGGHDLLRAMRFPHLTSPSEQSAEPDDLQSLVSKNFTHAKCLYCPKPPFDVDGQPNGPSGDVLVMALITTDGRPTHIRVVQSLSPERDEQAARAVKEWRFKPASKTPGGKPVAHDAAMWISFRPH